MANKPKVEFLTNIPVSLKLMNNFRNGDGEYGPWFGWGAIEAGVEKTLFANEDLHDKIKGYPKGTDLVITKQQIGPKQFQWFVMPAGMEPPQGIPQPIPTLPQVTANGRSKASEPVRTVDRAEYRAERILRAKDAINDALEVLMLDELDENVRALAISFLIDEDRKGIVAPEEGANF